MTTERLDYYDSPECTEEGIEKSEELIDIYGYNFGAFISEKYKSELRQKYGKNFV